MVKMNIVQWPHEYVRRSGDPGSNPEVKIKVELLALAAAVLFKLYDT